MLVYLSWLLVVSYIPISHCPSKLDIINILLGQYVIPLSYVAQLLKFAFNYQVYEIFESLIEPVSELIEQTDPNQISLLALLQIVYEIEQGDKDRKTAQNTKNVGSNKNGKDSDKRKQQKSRSKSPPKGKEGGALKKSPENGKAKMKKTKAVQELIDAAKATRTVPAKEVKILIEGEQNHEEDEETSMEELLEDLCFLLLTDPKIVCIFFTFELFLFVKTILFYFYF